MVDSFKSEVSEEFTKAYVNLSECEKDKDIKEESASACDELVTSPLSTDRCVEEEDLAKKVLLYKKIFHDDEELLNLQVISIEAWLLIQRATFDIHVNEEPYHSIQIYANLKKMRFVRRVWGISESSGELQNMEDLRDLCIATFKKSAVCLGHLCPDLREHPNLAEVPYPFKRWISGSCLIRYSQSHDDEAIGICSECSDEVTKINIIGFNEENLLCTETNEIFKKKCAIKDIHRLDHNNENDDCDAEALMEEKHETFGDADDSENNIGFENIADDEHGEIYGTKSSEKHVIGNEDYWKKIRHVSQEPTTRLCNADYTAKKKRNITADFTEKEQTIAKHLLHKYGALKPRKYGGNRLSRENNSAAFETFKLRTGREIDQGSWVRLCSRLRNKETQGKLTKEINEENDETNEVVLKDGNQRVEMPDTNPSIEAIADNHNNDENTTESVINNTRSETEAEGNDGQINNVNEISEHTIKNGSHMQRNKHRYFTADFTEQEQAIVKSLLQKYGSLKPVKDGGKRLRGEKNIAAMKAFNIRTGRQIDPTSWTRFCSRIRGRVAENSPSNSFARCGKCQEVFSSKTILLKHMRKSHYTRSSKKEMQTCDECGIQLADLNSLKNHKRRRHISYADREYKCEFPGCAKAFADSYLLKDHKALHDPGGTVYVCDHCGKTFRQKLSFLRHQQVHKKLEVKCRHCDEVFEDYYNRDAHTNIVHFPDRFRCDVCQKSFPRAGRLKIHQRRAHPKGGDHLRECPECGKKLSIVQFKHHMTLHTGDLSSCSYCPWKGQAPKLYPHIMLKHKEQWNMDQAAKAVNFKCPECAEFFMNSIHLSKHIGVKHKKSSSYWRSVSSQSKT